MSDFEGLSGKEWLEREAERRREQERRTTFKIVAFCIGAVMILGNIGGCRDELFGGGSVCDETLESCDHL